MPNEKQSPRLKLEDVARTAKTVTLRSGFHAPTVIADGSKNHVFVSVEVKPTSDERIGQMFLLGVALAESGKVGVLHQVFFISEAWMSVVEKRTPPPERPSKDPQRKEVLITSRLNIAPRETNVVIYEMKRNLKGKLIRLDDIAPADGTERLNVDTPLLEAFAMGFFTSLI